MATSALQSATKVAETITRQETPQREGMRHSFQGVGFAVEVNIGFGTQPTAQSVHAEACCIMVALHAEVTAGRCAVGNIEKATGQQRQEFLDESALPDAGFKIKLAVRQASAMSLAEPFNVTDRSCGQAKCKRESDR